MRYLNIYQKLIEVRKEVPYLQKESEGHQYKYTGSSQVLASVRKKLDDLNLLLIPRIVDTNILSETVDSTDKYNNPKKTTTYFTELTMTMTWVDADNPDDKIECPWYAQGVDIAGEKGVGKALTYGEKYFMLKFFNIATDKDDPDSFQAKHDLVEMINQKQISEIKELWTGLGYKEPDLNKQTAKLYKKSLVQLTEKMAQEFIENLKSMKDTKETA
ncbi:ERF family protein [Paenibacillus xylanexedens]|uniref:ERF family protein n=1 Tax=Paenibacillus xylanexedens TaxID=528191 RepID=UPI0037C71DF3